MQILLCVTAVACGYAVMQSTALLVMAVVALVLLILLVGLTGMIVLLLTVIEMLLYATEYLARGQFWVVASSTSVSDDSSTSVTHSRWPL